MSVCVHIRAADLHSMTGALIKVETLNSKQMCVCVYIYVCVYARAPIKLGTLSNTSAT